MRHYKLQDKTSRRTPSLCQRYSSVGRNANAAVPPIYGIDFVDRHLAERSHAENLTQFKEEAEPIQNRHAAQLTNDVNAVTNHTGMPDHLKVGIENLSGMSMDDVNVHYNSSRPAQLNALAYTQGTNIHVGPGQKQCLPHEAWHVVQQKQGRVKPTMQTQGVSINDDTKMEREADVMGAKALQIRRSEKSTSEFPAHYSHAGRKYTSMTDVSLVQRTLKIDPLDGEFAEKLKRDLQKLLKGTSIRIEVSEQGIVTLKGELSIEQQATPPSGYTLLSRVINSAKNVRLLSSLNNEKNWKKGTQKPNDLDAAIDVQIKIRGPALYLRVALRGP